MGKKNKYKNPDGSDKPKPKIEGSGDSATQHLAGPSTQQPNPCPGPGGDQTSTKLQPVKKEPVAQKQPKEQPIAQQPMEPLREQPGKQTQSREQARRPKDQARGQQPKEQAGGQPKEQTWGGQPKQQAWGQQPKQQAWGQQPKQQSRELPHSQQASQHKEAKEVWGEPKSSSKQPSVPIVEMKQSSEFKQGDAIRQPQPQYQQTTAEGRKQQENRPTSMAKMAVAPSYGVNTKRGTRGRPIKLETNYVKLIIDKIVSMAYQYDIKFDPDKPKRFLRGAFEEYCRHVKLPCKVAYDGRAIVFSPRKLPAEFCRAVQVTVSDPDPEANGTKEFTVTLTLTSDPEIQLNTLKAYHNIPVYDQPQRALQCVDIVLRSAFVNKGIRSGRSVYNKPDEYLNLEDGFEMWYGLFQSAVLGSQPFLNIDVCHRAFPSEKTVLQVCNNLSRYFDPRKPFHYNDKKALQSHLSGLKIIYDPPRCFNQSAKVFSFNKVLDDPADRQYFEVEGGKRITVAQYFQERNYRLEFPNLPCLHVGSRSKTIYVPIEFCRIPGGQLSIKKAGQNQVRNLIKYAAVSTVDRKRNIMKQFSRLDHNNDETVKAFGIQIGNSFIQINGRILDSPRLQYGNKELAVREGKWDSGRDRADFIIQSQITFGILVMDQRFSENEAREFGNNVVRWSNFGNIAINRQFNVFKVNNRNEQKSFEEYMLTFKNSFKANIVFVIISNFDYAKVKQWAEINYGILTQCVKSITVQKRLNQSTVQNILLKVNAKTNGLNHKISKVSQTSIMTNEDVMFIGADVTHPSPDQRDIPSVVGVAASHDLYGFQYNMQYRLQDPKKEMIDKMDDIMLTHLNIYKKSTSKLPKQILYYRDGVSDGQLPQVKDIELKAFDNAFRKVYGNQPKPKLTCLIVQKRHHTRFFPPSEHAFGKFKNVPPGTIVDTDITHPNECQFFLVSHESIQGTAKPTKYVVIRDDSNYNIDDLQAITNNMCHMFTRCNRAVSYPAPAYYAHLVAARGRVYIEGAKINLSNLDREYKNRTIHADIVNNYPMYFT